MKLCKIFFSKFHKNWTTGEKSHENREKIECFQVFDPENMKTTQNLYKIKNFFNAQFISNFVFKFSCGVTTEHSRHSDGLQVNI